MPGCKAINNFGLGTQTLSTELKDQSPAHGIFHLLTAWCLWQRQAG